MPLKPVVSVVIPAYNAEKTIEQTVLSATAQTEKNIEIITVDDASVDDTAKIIKKLAEADNRIRLIRLDKNSGVAFARNIAVKEAKGDYIAFLDSDDIWKPDKLIKQLKLAKEKDALIVYTGASCIDEAGNALKRVFSVPDEVSFEDLLSGNDIICSSALVKREAMLKNPMEHPDSHEDLLSWLSILKDGKKAYGINEQLTIYRIANGSKSGNKLKASVMQIRAYKYIKLPFFKAVFCFIKYSLHGIKRYYGKSEI